MIAETTTTTTTTMESGMYGCVTKPKDEKTREFQYNYLVKIQPLDDTVNEELKLGQLMIVTIPHYTWYVAPLLDSEMIQYQNWKDELSECKAYWKENVVQPALVSCRVRKVPHLGPKIVTCLDYYTTLKYPQHRVIQRELWWNQAWEALTKFQSVKLVHFDIKTDNFLFDAKLQRPIFIDLGISFVVDESVAIDIDLWKKRLKTKELHPIYPIEIYILAEIIFDVEYSENKILDASILSDWCDFFFENNIFIQQLPVLNNENEKKEWLKRTKQRLVNEMGGKEVSVVIQTMMGWWKSWDVYSLSILFLLMMMMNDDEHEEPSTTIIPGLQPRAQPLAYVTSYPSDRLELVMKQFKLSRID